MKKILVPTDFSKNADKALEYAITVANTYGAELHVLHAYHTSAGAGHLISADRIIHKEREADMAELIKRYKGLMQAPSGLEGSVRKDYTVDAISHTAEKMDAQLIIMGTRGATGLKKIFIGSTTTNLLKNTAVPVLAVPDKNTDDKPDNITIAIDSANLPDPSVLNPVISLANKFNAKINLLHIINNDSGEDIDETVREYFKTFGIPYSYFKLHDKDIKKGIFDFVERKESDLICMISHGPRRNWFENIFHQSVSRQIAMESEIPFLVLHG